jgi:hypothetical protein
MPDAIDRSDLMAEDRTPAMPTPADSPPLPPDAEISRRDAHEHGMDREGAVSPEQDAAEVVRRFAAMLDQMRPSCEMGGHLVCRLARLTVRVERCSDQELEAIASRAAYAEAGFDEVDHAIASIAKEPAT